MNFPIILASRSPRRQELLQQAGISFEVRVKDTDEVWPPSLAPESVAEYLAVKKAGAFRNDITHEVVIAADTIVLLGKTIMGKPADEAEALEMLRALSGNTHQVITGVCLLSKAKQVSFSETTQVSFLEMTDDEIRAYIQNCRPFDKAGAYGIQESIGLTSIAKINGSYFNVVGLPVHRVCQELKKW